MLTTGLTTSEAELRLEKFGPNDVIEQQRGRVKKFLAPLYSPISLMLLGAALLSKLSGKTFDCYFILALYLVNFTIQKWQEFKADRAIDELRNRLSFDVSTLRDGAWVMINAKNLVPGDRIRLGLGSIIPADATIAVTASLSVNEAVLTGESMPKEKKAGDKIFSGSFIATGNVEADITATGKNTSFGKTIYSIDQTTEKSILEKDILTITRFLTTVSIGAVVVLTIGLALKGFSYRDLLTLDVSLVIAGIPIALPAVMAIILSIGAAGLAKKLVVVRRLSALQDLANVNMLLTDKTGTLTKNEISITNSISYQSGLSTSDILQFADFATSATSPDTIELAIQKKFAAAGHPRIPADIIRFLPFDSNRKRATVLIRQGSEQTLISLGAPQVIKAFVDFPSPDIMEKFEADIASAATDGFRVLAVAIRRDGAEEQHMLIAGALFLTDPLDESSRTTIQFIEGHGIAVKMLTGDNRIIAERIAHELGLNGRALAAKDARALYHDSAALLSTLPSIAAFAEISPQDKYEIVSALKQHFVVAATGDGINDLPALKVAHVGIAVVGAVSALKSLSDIVLLGPGVAVIQDAILESRKIFSRLYSYSIYRISESFRLIITVLILGLWYGLYPLQPLQLILLAFLNDIPIISLAVDRVVSSPKPSEIHTKERFSLSLLFGLVGVVNSLSLFFLLNAIFHFPLPVIQTLFFLKLTVSGHSLIFVAHTKERWYKFLPAKAVIIATIATQIIATILAVTGWLMPARISLLAAGGIWLWALLWMQVSELMKDVQGKLLSQLKKKSKTRIAKSGQRLQ